MKIKRLNRIEHVGPIFDYYLLCATGSAIFTRQAYVRKLVFIGGIVESY